MYKLYKDESWLKQKYIKEGLSLRTIAELAEVSHVTIRDWLKRFGITIRKKNDYRKRTMTLEQAQAILAEPVGGFITQEEYEKNRQENHGRKRKEHLLELAAQLKRERLEMETDIVGNWHRGDIVEEMSDIQREFDTAEDQDKEKPVKATENERQYLLSKNK